MNLPQAKLSELADWLPDQWKDPRIDWPAATRFRRQTNPVVRVSLTKILSDTALEGIEKEGVQSREKSGYAQKC
jgi:hypothetical protein